MMRAYTHLSMFRDEHWDTEASELEVEWDFTLKEFSPGNGSFEEGENFRSIDHRTDAQNQGLSATLSQDQVETVVVHHMRHRGDTVGYVLLDANPTSAAYISIYWRLNLSYADTFVHPKSSIELVDHAANGFRVNKMIHLLKFKPAFCFNHFHAML